MAPVEPSNFGVLLRRYRVDAELTQEELAERARMSARAISDLERGVKHAPRVHTVRQLADALDLHGEDRDRFGAAAREAVLSPGADAKPGSPAETGRGGQGALPDERAASVAPRRRHNLPNLLTSFIGRQEEVAAATRCLTEARLLTLVGVGGCGKTRLALEVAGGLVERFPDGVWLVSLASLTNDELVVGTVAAALGISEQQGRPLVETVIDALEPKSLLLVLDNCEHVLQTATNLAAVLLERCPALHILATSREPLRIPGERLRQVPPLPFPDARGTVSVEDVREYESVQLLVDRVRYREPEFRLTATNAGACARIAGRLEGLPLAIELAAARVGALSVDQVASLLDDALSVLVFGSRTAQPRQQTLRGALDWSYNLLRSEEQRLFSRLSVFAGGWTLEAAQAVASTENESARDVTDSLSHLVEQSLVVREVRTDGSARFRMLEPVRQYAHGRLAESGEADAVHRRHAELLLALAEAAEPELAGPNQAAWLERLWTEADNTRAALLWARSERGDAALGLRLASRFSRLLLHRGDLREAGDWLRSMLALATDADAAIRARALQRIGVVTGNAGDTDAARAYYRQALEMFRGLGDDASVAWTLTYLSGVARQVGDRSEQRALIEQALPLARRLDDARLIGVLLGDLATVEEHEGDTRRARALREESLAIHRAMGNALMTAIQVFNVAVDERKCGHLERALSLVGEALSLFTQLGDQRMIAAGLDGIAAIEHQREQYERAITLNAAAQSLREACGAAADDEFYDDTRKNLDQARAAVGDGAFGAAWAVGRALSLEDAITFALACDASEVLQSDAATGTR